MQNAEKVLIEGIKSEIITGKTDLVSALKKALRTCPLKEKDVLVISSKVLAVTQGRVVAVKTAAAYDRLVQEEADQVIGRGAVTLTLKNGIFIPWAGIDRSNVRKGYAVLWPDKPFEAAAAIRRLLMKHYGLRDLGVIISDSHCIPLRRGVIGLALGYAGFRGVKDLRGQKDIYGNALKVTQQNHADMLATAAHLVTGEADERMPFALIRNARVDFTSAKIDHKEIIIKKSEDIFSPLY